MNILQSNKSHTSHPINVFFNCIELFVARGVSVLTSEILCLQTSLYPSKTQSVHCPPFQNKWRYNIYLFPRKIRYNHFLQEGGLLQLSKKPYSSDVGKGEATNGQIPPASTPGTAPRTPPGTPSSTNTYWLTDSLLCFDNGW